MSKIVKTLHIDLKQGLVCLTHFIKKYDDLMVDDTFRDFIGRGAGGQFKSNEKDLDLFIPVLLKSNSITYIFIQVKNQASKISSKMVKDLKPKIEYYHKNIKPYLLILMDLGNENHETIESFIVIEKIEGSDIHHFVFHGLTVFPILSELLIDKTLKLLLDNDKKTNFSLYSKDLCRHVFPGSMNYDRLDERKQFLND